MHPKNCVHLGSDVNEKKKTKSSIIEKTIGSQYRDIVSIQRSRVLAVIVMETD